MQARPTARPLRRDAQEHRDALLAAVGALLAERGPGFSLSEVAQRAGVSNATAYRHFCDATDAIDGYSDRLTRGLLAAFDALRPAPDPLTAIRELGQEWVQEAAGWGPAAVYLRSPRGFLARLGDGDPFITGLHERLERLLRSAIRAGVLPRQDVRYAVLIWVTIFDERVVVDLVGDLGLSPRQAARRMTGTLLAALRAGQGPG
jgi:AcrR family transcriptional regulator